MRLRVGKGSESLKDHENYIIIKDFENDSFVNAIKNEKRVEEKD